MQDLDLSFQFSKNISNNDLRIYFRNQGLKMSDEDKPEPEQIIRNFQICLQYLSSRTFDEITLTEFVLLYSRCWNYDPELIWTTFSKEITQNLKTNYSYLYSFVYFLSKTNIKLKLPDGNEMLEFITNFLTELSQEIFENQEEIENESVDTFSIFDICLNRKDLLSLIYLLMFIQPFEANPIFPLFPLLLSSLQTINLYFIFNYYIQYGGIHLLPQEIFLDQNYIQFTSVSVAAKLLESISDSDFLQMFPFYFGKLDPHSFLSEKEIELSRTFLLKFSTIDNPLLTQYMNDKMPIEYRKNSTRMTFLFSKLRDDDIVTPDLLLLLKQYDFKLPMQISERFNDLPDSIDFLIKISLSPYKSIDHEKLKAFLLQTTDYKLISCFFVNQSDDFFPDLEIWEHIIPILIDKFSNITLLSRCFINIDEPTAIQRMADILFHNYPQNMTRYFTCFADMIIHQLRDYHTFDKLPQTQDFIAQCHEIFHKDFWNLFYDPAALINFIGEDPNGHIELLLGLYYVLINSIERYAYRENTHFVFAFHSITIEEQTPESLAEINTLIRENELNALPTTISHKALTLLVPAFLSSLDNISKFTIDGLDQYTILPFLCVAFTIQSQLPDFGEPSVFGAYQFLLNKTIEQLFLDQIEQNYSTHNYEIAYILKHFPKLTGNVLEKYHGVVIKILHIFQSDPALYLNFELSNTSDMSCFLSNLINIPKQSSWYRNIITTVNSISGYILYILIKHSCRLPPQYFDKNSIRNCLITMKTPQNPIFILKFILQNEIEIDQAFSDFFFSADELYDMMVNEIVNNDSKNIDFIFAFASSANKITPKFVSLIDLENLPKTIKFPILLSVPGEIRNYITFDKLITIINSVEDMISRNHLPMLVVSYFLDENSLYNVYMIQFEKFPMMSKSNDFSIYHSNKYKVFKQAFLDVFQPFQIGKKKYMVKKCRPIEYRPNGQFQMNCLLQLIQNVIEKPTHQLYLALEVLVFEFPFFFVDIELNDLLDAIFKTFEIFRTYKGFLINANTETETQFDDLLLANHYKNNFTDLLQNQAESDINSISKIQNEDEDNKLIVAYSALALLNCLITIPKCADGVFHYLLNHFDDFSVVDQFAFISTVTAVAKSQNNTLKHVMYSYFIKYDFLNRVLAFLPKIPRPFSNLSCYVYYKFVLFIRYYFINEINSLDSSMLTIYKELIEKENPCQFVFDQLKIPDLVLHPNFEINITADIKNSEEDDLSDEEEDGPLPRDPRGMILPGLYFFDHLRAIQHLFRRHRFDDDLLTDHFINRDRFRDHIDIPNNRNRMSNSTSEPNHDDHHLDEARDLSIIDHIDSIEEIDPVVNHIHWTNNDMNEVSDEGIHDPERFDGNHDSNLNEELSADGENYHRELNSHLDEDYFGERNYERNRDRDGDQLNQLSDDSNADRNEERDEVERRPTLIYDRNQDDFDEYPNYHHHYFDLDGDNPDHEYETDDDEFHMSPILRPNPFYSSEDDSDDSPFFNWQHIGPQPHSKYLNYFHRLFNATFPVRNLINFSISCLHTLTYKSYVKDYFSPYDIFELQTEQPSLDLSLFTSIHYPEMLSYLPDDSISIMLKDLIDWPNEASLVKMGKFLLTKPAYISYILRNHEKILLPPQYYCEIQKCLFEYKQFEEQNSSTDNETKNGEMISSKDFLHEFYSSLNADYLISAFYDSDASLVSSFPSLLFISTANLDDDSSETSLFYIANEIAMLLNDLASKRNDLLPMYLNAIEKGIYQTIPVHAIELLSHLKIFVASSKFKANCSVDSLTHIFKMLLSPQVRINSRIIRLTIEIVYTLLNQKDQEKNEKVNEAINRITFDVFSFALESNEHSLIEAAISASSALNNEMKKQIEPILLAQFDKLTNCFTEQSIKNKINNFDFVLIDVLIRKFKSVVLKRKEKLLLILRYYCDYEFGDLYPSIGSIIDLLCPPRTDSIDIQQQQQQPAHRQIFIPVYYYNKYPEFWDIILDFLPQFHYAIDHDHEFLNTFFHFLVSYQELLSFQQKCNFFKDRQHEKIGEYTLKIDVRRSHLLADSFNRLNPALSKEKVLSRFRVRFENEPGIDLSGLTKEWLTLVVKELFNPDYALFAPTEDCRSYQPNPSSHINSEHHIEYFEFAGQIIARAIIEGVSVDAHLTTSFIKQILGLPLTLKDLEDTDQKLYRSLVWILENSVNPLDIRFTTGFQDIEENTTTIELKPNGENIVVDDDNKKEYVDLFCHYKMERQIKDQIEAFKKGFYKLIGRDEIELFTPNEFDLLICGIPNIDVNDLRENCEFQRPYTKDHPVIKMFFNVISSWEHEKLAKLLLFITGSSQVPVGGFKRLRDLKKPIVIAHVNDSTRLPQAHTCFNKLDLPEYRNEEELRSKLLLSISECQNFEIA